jgi:hypothetical protein
LASVSGHFNFAPTPEFRLTFLWNLLPPRTY